MTMERNKVKNYAFAPDWLGETPASAEWEED
jgi:hypothetical protein